MSTSQPASLFRPENAFGE